jgi:hypothetical protein
MKNLTPLQLARIRLAKTNAKKRADELAQTAPADQPSDAVGADTVKKSQSDA